MPVYRDRDRRGSLAHRHGRPVVRWSGGLARGGREPPAALVLLRLSAPRSRTPGSLGRAHGALAARSRTRCCCYRASRTRSRGSTSCGGRRPPSARDPGHLSRSRPRSSARCSTRRSTRSTPSCGRIPDRSCRQFARILAQHARFAARPAAPAPPGARPHDGRACWRPSSRSASARSTATSTRSAQRASRSTRSAARTAGSSWSMATGPG